MMFTLEIRAALLCVVLVVCTGYTGEYGGTMMEEKLETQIDTRPPRSFMYWDNLVTRQEGFHELNYKEKGKAKTAHVSNWETYTLRYWYEYRLRNAECPMKPIGIAAATDWSLLCTCLFGAPADLGTSARMPRTIFVHTYMLSHFYESTLMYMNKTARFILYTGGTDMTIPEATGDARYSTIRWFGTHGKGWEAMIKDPRIVHWYAENHDIDHPKLSTLPTGFTKGSYQAPLPSGVSYPDGDKFIALDKRPLTVLHADRVRDGRGQWHLRKRVEDMCDLIDWCVQPVENLKKRAAEKEKEQTEVGLVEGDNGGEGEVTHEKFLEYLHNAPFIACVHGGGIDPSPKAFEAMYHGTIPIVRKSVLYDSYSKFPVAWVDSWEELFNATESARQAKMKEWIKELAPFYQKGSALRRQTLDRMKTAYWIEEGHKRLERGLAEEQSKSKDKDKDKGKHHRHHLRRSRRQR